MRILSLFEKKLLLHWGMLIFLLPLSLFTLTAQGSYDIKMQLQAGDRLYIKKVDKSISKTEVPLLGDQIVTVVATYQLRTSVLAKKGENFLIQCDVTKVDLDVQGSKNASKKAFDAVVELIRPYEIVKKSIQVEVDPYFRLAGTIKEKGTNANTPIAKRIFTMVSDILRPTYAGRTVALGEVWSDREESGNLIHSHISEVAGSEAILEGTIAVYENGKNLKNKGTGTFDSRVDLHKGILRSSHSSYQTKGKVRVMLFNLDFSSSRQISTQVLLK